MRSALGLFLLSGCVLDRTGQSSTANFQRQIQEHAAKLETIDRELDKADARIGQLEELTRARGQDEIQKMESIDQIRDEVARLRGDLEVLNHDWESGKSAREASSTDEQYRLAWLESRADALEKSLGLRTPPPPTGLGASGAGTGAGGATAVVDPATAGAGGQQGAAGTPAVGTGATPAANPVETQELDPDAMLALAADHLAGGREEAAEAVLNRFLKQYPDNARVDEAKYRLAEAKFNAKNYPAAVIAFQRVIDEHKDSQWAAWAMLRQGECFEKQGQKENAKLFYEDTLRLYPKSKAAKEAKTKLGK